jgi:nitroimidazol reductase NimA-like FMN-containing flavoprotein (pyridoxamine 5'-phosphate oxidase superfamily)
MKPIPRAVRDYIKRAPVARVSSVLPNNVPHVSPVCPVYDGEYLYIDVAKNGKTAAALKANPHITLSIDDYYANWRRLRGVILYTRAKEARGEAKRKAWRLIRRKFPQSVKAEWNPRLTLVLRIENWTQWGVTG